MSDRSSVDESLVEKTRGPPHLRITQDDSRVTLERPEEKSGANIPHHSVQSDDATDVVSNENFGVPRTPRIPRTSLQIEEFIGESKFRDVRMFEILIQYLPADLLVVLVIPYVFCLDCFSETELTSSCVDCHLHLCICQLRRCKCDKLLCATCYSKEHISCIICDWRVRGSCADCSSKEKCLWCTWMNDEEIEQAQDLEYYNAYFDQDSVDSP